MLAMGPASFFSFPGSAWECVSQGSAVDARKDATLWIQERIVTNIFSRMVSSPFDPPVEGPVLDGLAHMGQA